MKLNLGKRIILFIHWLFSLAAVVMTVIFCIKPDIMWNGFNMVYDRIGKRQTDIIGAACLAVYVILSIATVIITVSNKEKREQRSFIIVDSSETGRTRIAVSAVEQMIRQAVRGMEEIKSMKTSIQNMGDSIAINSDVTIADGAHVPSVTAAIQRSVRSYIELNCGVSVKSICVNVRAVEQNGQKGKRSAKTSSEKPNAPVQAEKVSYTEEPLKTAEAEVTPEMTGTDIENDEFEKPFEDKAVEEEPVNDEDSEIN